MAEPRYSMTIGGRKVSGAGQPVPVENPASGAVFDHAPGCTEDQLNEAVAAARTAFPAWSALPFAERKQKVAAIAGVINDHLDELKELLTLEQGKPYDMAIGELQGTMYWASAIAGLEMPVDVRESEGRRAEVRHLPLGVIGGIVPWNYPVLSAMMKIAPALAAGNTMVLKPAPTTPLATLRLGELLTDLLPAGVLNIVSGGNDLGPWITAHPDIDKISFTGSSATGKRIMASAADRIKRFTLELGGNDAAIVFPDVDVDEVAQKIFWGALMNSGQVCVAAKRIYVHEDIYDRFRDAFVGIAKATKMGVGSEAGVQLGPVQNKAQYQRIVRLADNARDAGLTLIQADKGAAPGGYFFPVTVVDNPPDTAEVVTEEPFGPIVPLLKWRDAEDVIARANGTRYGLAGSVWSKDVAAASAIADRLDCGCAWVNTIMDAPPDQPLGGHKESGFGVENGLLGLLEYTSVQTRVTVTASVAAPVLEVAETV